MINIIVASSLNNIIGEKNTLPWKCPGDMKFFKEKTSGNIVVMGYNTYVSLNKKELPNRKNILISQKHQDENIETFGSINDFIKKYRNSPTEIFVIGGNKLYQSFLENDLIDTIYRTVIHKNIEGDTSFEFNQNKFELVYRSEIKKQQEPEELQYSFETYKKAD
jgi:dihydrofolate reductase